ncbi:methyltransferase type 12 [Wenzhouxiangella sp. C33]|uniref:Methyltransferase type 12 n=2 Tax=Wenzhouxiangella limi TaxID=2707351 RepID=A0A845UYF6_9GAMM|nr:methyltransferase type 12 [Wenzhouxiangella limi]
MLEEPQRERSHRGSGVVAFFRGFLRSPEQVGSVVPSSRFLEQRLVRLAGVGQARCVVELGPGTGGTTRALLAGMPADAKLLTIELDARFAELLSEIDDPRLISHTGSAAELGEILDLHNLPAPDAVVSGIPFSTMPRQIGNAVLEAVRDRLAPGGVFVAYQFRGHVGRMGREVLGQPDIEVEALNVPPMRFFKWVRG